MKSPQSEASASPVVHGENIQRELSQLIDHLLADTGRVNDPAFRALLETSVEVLKGLRAGFECFGRVTAAPKAPSRGAVATGKSAAPEKPAERPDTKDSNLAGGTRKEAPSRKATRPPPTPAANPRPAPTPAHSQPADPDEIAAKAKQQRQDARAAKFPGGHSAPRPTPPQSGKPIWDKPHSS